MHMAMYAMQFAAQRRTEAPRDDLTSLILAGNFGDGPMSDLEFGIFFVQLVTAGNDTTKTMLSAGLLALLQHPEQMAEVRADVSLLPGAVEEILRYENPLHYFRRTATADSVLHGTEIAAGDKVLMYYTSANRDETVFTDPHRFDIHRVAEPAPLVRHRRALLPRRAPRPARGPGVLRGGAVDVLQHRAHRRSRAGALQPQQRLQEAARATVRLSTRLTTRGRSRRGRELLEPAVALGRVLERRTSSAVSRVPSQRPRSRDRERTRARRDDVDHCHRRVGVSVSGRARPVIGVDVMPRRGSPPVPSRRPSSETGLRAHARAAPRATRPVVSPAEQPCTT